MVDHCCTIQFRGMQKSVHSTGLYHLSNICFVAPVINAKTSTEQITKLHCSIKNTRNLPSNNINDLWI